MNAATELQASARWRTISYWTALIAAIGGVITVLFPNLSPSQIKSLEDVAIIVVTWVLSATAISVVHARNAVQLTTLAAHGKDGG